MQKGMQTFAFLFGETIGTIETIETIDAIDAIDAIERAGQGTAPIEAIALWRGICLLAIRPRDNYLSHSSR